MVKGFEDWLRGRSELDEEAARLGLDSLPPASPPAAPAAQAPLAVLCSPHPDDEVITGALAFRLRREGWRIVNLAVTLGSDPARRGERRDELERCCARLGFELQVCGDDGFERVRLDTRREEPGYWHQMVGDIARRLRELAPRIVVFPHAADQHPTHIGVYGLVRQALVRAFTHRPVWCVETEFWAPMTDPSLLIEVNEEVLARLLEALLCHQGEVQRNPYHLRLPAWMEDSSRRASELLQGMGAGALPVRRGTLYRHYRWSGGQGTSRNAKTAVVMAEESVADLFPSFLQNAG